MQIKLPDLLFFLQIPAMTHSPKRLKVEYTLTWDEQFYKDILNEMMAFLMKTFDLDDTGLCEFFARLHSISGCIAGSFPLWFCTKPHRQRQWPIVQERLEALQECIPLPEPAIEKIGWFMRCQMHEQYRQSMDIDIFTSNVVFPAKLKLTGWTLVDHSREIYETFNDTFQSDRYQKEGSETSLNIIHVGNFPIVNYVDNFDLGICKIRLVGTSSFGHGELRTSLPSSPGAILSSYGKMTTKMDLKRYRQQIAGPPSHRFFLLNLTLDCVFNDFNAKQTLDDLPKQISVVVNIYQETVREAMLKRRQKIADIVQKRFWKYSNRGFLITNRDEVFQFIETECSAESLPQYPSFKLCCHGWTGTPKQVFSPFQTHLRYERHDLREFVQFFHRRKKVEVEQQLVQIAQQWYDAIRQAGCRVAKEEKLLNFIATFASSPDQSAVD